MSKIISYFLTELACFLFSLDSYMSGLYFMHGELAKGMPKFNADKYQTTIHLHVLGPGSFPELPIFQKYISNINVHIVIYQPCYINNVVFHFDIHKTIAYRIINRFVLTKLAGDRPNSGRQKKTNSTGGKFHSEHIKTGDFLTANPLCITSRNCLCYVSVHRNCPECLRST